MAKLTLYKLTKVFEKQHIKCSHTDCPHDAQYGQSFSTWLPSYYCKDHWRWGSEAKLELYLVEPKIVNETQFQCCCECHDV